MFLPLESHICWFHSLFLVQSPWCSSSSSSSSSKPSCKSPQLEMVQTTHFGKGILYGVWFNSLTNYVGCSTHNWRATMFTDTIRIACQFIDSIDGQIVVSTFMLGEIATYDWILNASSLMVVALINQLNLLVSAQTLIFSTSNMNLFLIVPPTNQDSWNLWWGCCEAVNSLPRLMVIHSWSLLWLIAKSHRFSCPGTEFLVG